MATYKESITEATKRNNGRSLSDEELKRLKKTLLNCLEDVQRVCDKYNLNLMLGGGSCLGAVRHGGFIPWDDDLDLNISRSDYEVFKEIFKEELGDKYVLNAPNYDGNQISRFPKILIKGTRFVELGMEKDSTNAMIKIDLFIAENIPDNPLHRRLKGLYCNLLMGITGSVELYTWYKREPNNKFFSLNSKNSMVGIRKTAGALFSFLPLQFWFDRVDKACRYRNNSKCIGFPTGRKHYFGEIHARDDIFPLADTKFESIMVHIPGNYDKYLTKLYGSDYMTVPPEDKREKHFILDIEFPT